jgi:hypothetical protein
MYLAQKKLPFKEEEFQITKNKRSINRDDVPEVIQVNEVQNTQSFPIYSTHRRIIQTKNSFKQSSAVMKKHK